VADRITPEERSANMRAVKSKDTGPELAVRRAVYRLGFRYRLHRRDLPGKPDLVFGPKRKIIFVHGCFWHGHDECRGSGRPKSNAIFWEAKLTRNKERDAERVAALTAMGWNVLTVWECETVDLAKLERRLLKFLQE
jgi:DNA mismatch endonuclease, patch repair protein